MPQLFVKKEFIGGYFVIAEFILSGELARITKNKANLPLDSKYKSSKQNSIWRMKKVEPDRVLYSTADSNLVRLSGETEELIIKNFNSRWINCFALVPNQKDLIYIGSSDSNIYTYDYSSRAKKLFVSDHNRWINDIKLSHDLRYGFSVCGGGYIIKWCVTSGEVIITKQISSQCIWSLDISEQIISLGDNNGDIFIIDHRANLTKVINKAHDACITKILYCAEKDIWLSASYDEAIRIWSSNLTFLYCFKKHSARIWDIIYIPKNNLFVSISAHKEMILWNADNFHEEKTIETDIFPVSLCYNEGYVVIGGVNGEVRKYQVSGN